MTAARELDSPWLTVTEAAGRARCGPDHVRAALASSELRGSQRRPKGRWLIHVEDLDNWVRGIDAPIEPPTVARARR